MDAIAPIAPQPGRRFFWTRKGEDVSHRCHEFAAAHLERAAESSRLFRAYDAVTQDDSDANADEQQAACDAYTAASAVMSTHVREHLDWMDRHGVKGGDTFGVVAADYPGGTSRVRPRRKAA